jgi:hypothetical protein
MVKGCFLANTISPHYSNLRAYTGDYNEFDANSQSLELITTGGIVLLDGYTSRDAIGDV